MTIRFRLGLALVLFFGLFGTTIHYDTQYAEQWPYPLPDELAESYESHVGEQTLLFGTVRDVDPDAETARIAVDHSTGTLVMTVHSFHVNPEPGGTVQVFGTLGQDHTMTAEQVVIVNPVNASRLYKYAVSVLGALLVMIVFFRSWRIDPETFAFEKRRNG